MVGHEWAVTLLQHHIEQGQMRHAYLFTGPPAVGRRTLALRFAQALNCIQPEETGVPCYECRPCKQIEKMQQTDLTIVTPQEGSTTVKVDQIRALQHTLSLSPYEARFRIALLPDFQRATTSAQNALLKTLEEAPRKVILLVTADSAENLLPTIVSRCEVMRLRPVGLELLEDALETKWSLPTEDARLLAHLSSGRPGFAIKSFHDPDDFVLRMDWIEDLIRLSTSNRRERFQYAEMYKSRESRAKAIQIFQAWLLFWRDLLLTVSGADVPLVNLDWAPQIQDMARFYDLSQLRKIIADLEQGLTKLIQTNVNTRLLIEVILMDWPRLQ